MRVRKDIITMYRHFRVRLHKILWKAVLGTEIGQKTEDDMKNRKSWAILLTAALLLTASCFAAVFADDAVPGTAADPVVSKSYMDAQISILQTQIKTLQEQIDDLQASGGQEDPPASSDPSEQTDPGEQTDPAEQPKPAEVPKFEVIKVEAGQSVIGGASTEIILRSGTATAIAGASGGVADITEGVDLSQGTDVTKNHLLIIPVDDGRGIACTSMCYVMVKGDYTLK